MHFFPHKFLECLPHLNDSNFKILSDPVEERPLVTFASVLIRLLEYIDWLAWITHRVFRADLLILEIQLHHQHFPFRPFYLQYLFCIY